MIVLGILRFQKWFDVDVLGFQQEVCLLQIFYPFLTWQLFWLFFEKCGNFFLISGHPGQDGHS
jgi:hypothetical protein